LIDRALSSLNRIYSGYAKNYVADANDAKNIAEIKSLKVHVLTTISDVSPDVRKAALE